MMCTTSLHEDCARAASQYALEGSTCELPARHYERRNGVAHIDLAELVRSYKTQVSTPTERSKPRRSRTQSESESASRGGAIQARVNIVGWSGNLWKLGSGERDRKDLRNWRRRFFQISRVEPLGLVLAYISEKENCEGLLGAILCSEDGKSRARISKLAPVKVSELDAMDERSMVASGIQYDLAVHRSRRAPSFSAVVLPQELHRVAIDATDAQGNAGRLELALADADALTDFVAMLETVIQQHSK